MKRAVNMLLVLPLVIWIGAFLPGCGHGDDASPYETAVIEEGDGTPEVLSPTKHAAIAVDRVAGNIFVTGVALINSLGFRVTVPMDRAFDVIQSTTIIERDILDTHKVIIEGLDTAGNGNGMSAVGKAVFLQNTETHCVIFSTLKIDYDNFRVHPEVTLNGSGQVSILLTSYGCIFARNTHANISLVGDFAADDQSFNELLFKADYVNGVGFDMRIASAVVRGDDYLGYCMTTPYDETGCYRWDKREPVNYCSSEADICEVTNEGHEYCRELLGSPDGAYCNLGCCVEGTNWQNTCNADPFARRDCNATEDTFFTDTYLLWGRKLMAYEVPIRCSEDGLWTPPCPLDGSYDVCPHGGICVPPDDEGWGLGLEAYGYCSCTEPAG